jgi:hypothetical protein
LRKMRFAALDVRGDITGQNMSIDNRPYPRMP